MGATAFCLLTLQNISIQSKKSDIEKYPLCLGNISGSFLANNMTKSGLSGCVCDFLVDNKAFDNSNIY